MTAKEIETHNWQVGETVYYLTFDPDLIYNDALLKEVKNVDRTIVKEGRITGFKSEGESFKEIEIDGGFLNQGTAILLYDGKYSRTSKPDVSINKADIDKLVEEGKAKMLKKIDNAIKKHQEKINMCNEFKKLF